MSVASLSCATQKLAAGTALPAVCSGSHESENAVSDFTDGCGHGADAGLHSIASHTGIRQAAGASLVSDVAPGKSLDGTGWIGKVLAGLILGAVLAIGLMGILGLLFHADAQLKTATSQILRWFPGPVWGLIVAFSFLFHTSRQAWLALAVINGVVWALFFLLHGIMA